MLFFTESYVAQRVRTRFQIIKAINKNVIYLWRACLLKTRGALRYFRAEKKEDPFPIIYPIYCIQYIYSFYV